MSNEKHLQLGRRERQIMDVIYRRGRASVTEVLAELTDPPSYSAVRGMLGLEALAALLEMSDSTLSTKDKQYLSQLIKKAQQEGR